MSIVGASICRMIQDVKCLPHKTKVKLIETLDNETKRFQTKITRLQKEDPTQYTKDIAFLNERKSAVARLIETIDEIPDCEPLPEA